MYLDKSEITAIFNDIAREFYNTQKEKYKQKQLFDLDVYCCSEEEVENFFSIFRKLLDMEDTMDFMTFNKIINGEGLSDSEDT